MVLFWVWGCAVLVFLDAYRLLVAAFGLYFGVLFVWVGCGFGWLLLVLVAYC